MAGSSSSDGVTSVAAAAAPENSPRQRTDNPIEEAAEDRLQRYDAAKSFVRQVLDLDASRGLTVGVFGPWGSGKTSFVNLALREFRYAGLPTLTFNPWMFSDTEQLMVRFFGELSAGMGRKEGLEDAGRAIAKYSSAIVGTANIVSTALTGMPGLGKLLEPFLNAVEASTGEQGVGELREAVADALGARDAPIVVVLDDVDRLTFEEIRQVFKLVRLTASFPNLVYVVVCDRRRVEHALDEQGERAGFGRDYLEKIIQYPFDLPAVPRHLLRREFEDSLQEALTGLDLAPFETRKLWPKVYADIVEPLIGNMRDVRRYAAAVRGTVEALAGNIEMADLLALEAIRLFLPTVFTRLHAAIDAITYPADSRANERTLRELPFGGVNSNPRLKHLVKDLVDGGTDRPGVVEALLLTLFPYGHWYLKSTEDTWEPSVEQGARVARRVADEAVFRLYLERVEGVDLGVLRVAEQALRSLGDADRFESVLRSVDPEAIIDVVRDLGRLSDGFERTHAEQGIPVLLNLLPEIPDAYSLLHRPRDVFEAVVGLLLVAAGDRAAVAAATANILPRLKTLGSKAILLYCICRSGDEDQRLVTPEVATELDENLNEEIRQAFEADAINETAAYAWVVSYPARTGTRLDLPDSPEVAFRLVNSAFSVTRSSHGAAREVDWGLLKLLYGDKDSAVACVTEMCDMFDAEAWTDRLGRWGIPLSDAEATIEMALASLPADSERDSPA